MLHDNEIPFAVGDIVRMNPSCKYYDMWSKRETNGPFVIIRVGDYAVSSEMRRLSDNVIIPCGKPTSWWLVLDPFLDAAHKANGNNI